MHTALHRECVTNTLLRRGLWPGTREWDAARFSARHPSEVQLSDVRRVLARPDLFPVRVRDTRTARKMASCKYPYPNATYFAREMFAADVELGYGTLTSGTGGITSLATSSTWVAGYEWYVVDNTASAPAGLQIDWFCAGQVTVGTTPTASTEIRHYLVGSPDGTFWPDVFDGTASAETVTSAGILASFPLAKVSNVDATTSNRAYPYAFGARYAFQGVIPKKFVHFVAHNTGVNLNSTAGNHSYYAQPEYVTVA